MSEYYERKPKSEFYWASIAGADPEPVERCEISGRPAVLTFGCPDPFFLDVPDCVVVLGSREQLVRGGKVFTVLDTDTPLPIVRPTLKSKADPEIKRAESNWVQTGPHSWRGPR